MQLFYDYIDVIHSEIKSKLNKHTQKRAIKEEIIFQNNLIFGFKNMIKPITIPTIMIYLYGPKSQQV